MLHTPVFLHSSWRTGSTYVWAKFRALQEAYCYFEPLNEHLATETQTFIDNFVPWAYAHHPKLDAPYLEEFRPLLQNCGGISGFPAALTYGRYCADRTAHLPELESYFGRLASFAKGRGKRPVFGCVRTNLRVDWFRHHLEGVHIFLLRDPRRQFISYLNQGAKGNRYFLERGWVILGNNRNDPAFAPLRGLVEVPAYEGLPGQQDAFYCKLASETEWSKLYMIFYFLHLLTMKNLHSDSFDLLIDLDRMSNDPIAMYEAERNIAELAGAELSFADCKIESYDDYLKWSAPFFSELEMKVTRLLN